MAPLPNNSIEHFTHPGHALTPIDSSNEFICDGCKTLGTGKRYRCTTNGCDFDLHEYCATCPRALTTFMHRNHALTLVMRKQQGVRQLNRICDVCAEPVEGLFYRCKDCEFDVHPLCTQLPEKLQHAMDKIHPLILQSPEFPGLCAVCRGRCAGWRYRCGICHFDVHLECVLVPFVSGPEMNSQTSDRGIPFQPPPPHYAGYSYGFPYGPGHYNNMGSGHYNNMGSGHYNNFGPGYGNNFGPVPGMQYVNPNNPMGQNQNQVGVGNNNNNGAGRRVKSMFSLVGQLGLGVISNTIFGVDFVSLFTG